MYNLYSLKIKELLFSPIRSTSVYFGLLQSTLVPFSPIWSTGEIFFPQVLYLGQEPTKTEHLGKKLFPVGTRVLETQVPTGEIFFPRCSVFVGSRPKQSIWEKKFPQ